MAYFANGAGGSCFEEQCAQCKYGDGYCPINYVQVAYNRRAVNNEVASEILNHLVSQCGNCAMYQEFKGDFESKEE